MKEIENYSFKNDKYGIELFEAIKKYDRRNSVDYFMVQKAFNLSKKYHEGQNRKSGDPYYSHPVAVAAIIAEYDCTADMICAALLHDTVEDTENSLTKIRFIFNDNIADTVDGVTNLDLKNTIKIKQVSNIYKIHKRREVILLKLCDRLHNTQTMSHMKPCKIKKKISENVSAYIPLAKSEGFTEIAKKLEQFSSILFKQLGL